MGRKNSNIAGLARFVAQAFSQADDGSSSATTSVTTTVTTLRSEVVTGATAGIKKRASEAQDVSTSEYRGSKKRKVGLLGPGLEKYDVTGLVPFYTKPSQVPAHLQKYFSQRERYFSQYSSGCLLDEEGWYSVTPERIADRIAERCRCGVVLDAFCGVGGNAIAFARTCERVIALDISPVRLALARHNATLYGVADRIEFILADFLSFACTTTELQTRPQQNIGDDVTANSDASARRKIDVVFLSPPWGGPSYLSDSTPSANGAPTGNGDASPREPPEYSLASIRPVHGGQLFKVARGITKNVAYFLPRNVRLEEVAALLDGENKYSEVRGEKDLGPTQGSEEGGRGENADEVEMVEVEEEWMGSKLKALTCYFGGLAAGQEHLF